MRQSTPLLFFLSVALSQLAPNAVLAYRKQRQNLQLAVPQRLPETCKTAIVSVPQRYTAVQMILNGELKTFKRQTDGVGTAAMQRPHAYNSIITHYTLLLIVGKSFCR